VLYNYLKYAVLSKKSDVMRLRCVFCGALAIAVGVAIGTKKAASLFIGIACSVLSRAISDSLPVRYL
jgi:hypothetical protein